MLATTTPKLHLHDCTYTSCYCEENVYLLLKQLLQQHDRPASQLFAVFISNPHETVSTKQLGRCKALLTLNGTCVKPLKITPGSTGNLCSRVPAISAGGSYLQLRYAQHIHA